MLYLHDEEIKAYRYTKIEVPLTLEQSPSDDADSAHYLDIGCDQYRENDCYIGSYHIDHISFTRKSAVMDAMNASRWDVSITLTGGLTEKEVCTLLDTLCDHLTLACCKTEHQFQYGGITGFTYRMYEIRRRYANNADAFGDFAINQYCGPVEIHTCSKLPPTVLALSKKQEANTALSKVLNQAFLTAMKSKDAVSRYILLYYMFEILYASDAYQSIKQDYERQHPGVKVHPDQKRSALLCQYLRLAFDIRAYQSFDRQFELTPAILFEIISVRNDLTHRADTTKISLLMYRHMLPILQELIRLL